MADPIDLVTRSLGEVFGGVTREQYQNARPFPHCIVDDLFNPEALDRVLEQWPDESDSRWKQYDGAHEWGKREGSDKTLWSGAPRAALTFIQHGLRVPLMELTGEPELIGDTHGGGLHDIEPGGYLDLHVDFDIHPETNRERRLNVLLFLNKNYSSEQQGQLQLVGDSNGSNVSIEPLFNRLVIFTVGSGHWHGHPAPWQGSEHRRSLAAYFYGAQPSSERIADQHSTIWLS